VALTTDRPYRAALTPAEALAEIAQGAGKQFDPAVAAALPQAIDRGVRVGRLPH
jgi:HD-GYP domain-containing protein (c-di-GMP phosphodiesterase class II)